MQFGQITEHIDLAQIALYLFWAFFAYLVYYLQRETRREGFPLVSDPDGKPLQQDHWIPKPKTFLTNDGRTKLAPDPAAADTRALNAEFVVGGPGSPIVPNGNPMIDGIGPAAWAERPDVPDLNFEQHVRIVPMRVASDFSVAEQDIDPRGCEVFGADGEKAGTVTDIWVDKSDYIIRYLEVELPVAAGAPEGTAAKSVLLPFNMADLRSDRDYFMEFIRMKKPKVTAKVHVNAILASQFADVPQIKKADQITLLEEEKVAGYYGGGYLYATPQRQEPLV